MSFKDKVVIITGASSGIGVEIAKLFAKEAAKLAITGRNAERLKETSEQCVNISGETPLEIIADIANVDEARNIISKTVDHYKRLDIVINNAGIMLINSILDDNFLKTFDQVMAVDLRATVVLMQEAAPHLIQTKGNIVNVSSIVGTSPFAGGAPYCGSKAALDHVTRCIALELAPKGVRVNVVSPGPVMTDQVLQLQNPEKFKSVSKAYAPLPVETGPADVAELVVFLASDKARSVTGATYVIDSGCVLKGVSTLIELFTQ